MNNPWFKRGAGKYERPFVVPAQTFGHVSFGVLVALIFVNIRIAVARGGIDGVFVMGFVLFASLIIAATLLNFAPEKFIKDEGRAE